VVAGGQRLGQNVPVCTTFFLPPFLWIWGISLRAWCALRFKWTFWDYPCVRSFEIQASGSLKGESKYMRGPEGLRKVLKL
jgi:hypothetical protein